MVITSRHNNTVKLVRSLHDRKARRETGLFLAEGIGMLALALRAGYPVEFILTSTAPCGSEIGRQALRAAGQLGVPTIEVTPEVFASLTDDRSQGVITVARQQLAHLRDMKPHESSLWLAVASIQYPANLGTLLRTADAVGCERVLLLDGQSDPFAPAAVRASRGAVFTARLARTNLGELAAVGRHGGLRIVGTSPAAPDSYAEVAYPRPCVVLVGNERHGLSRDEMAACDQLVSIPMLGQCDSLNVAVAASIVLYQALRGYRRAS